MLLTIAALALGAPQTCRSYDAALPRAYAGWTRSGRTLDTGHAVTLAARRGTASASVRIRKAGTFGVAVDRDGWIDIARAGGKPLRMTRDGIGPRCSTIAKIVWYRLQPGTYRIAVTRLRASRVRLMLVHD